MTRKEYDELSDGIKTYSNYSESTSLAPMDLLILAAKNILPENCMQDLGLNTLNPIIESDWMFSGDTLPGFIIGD